MKEHIQTLVKPLLYYKVEVDYLKLKEDRKREHFFNGF